MFDSDGDGYITPEEMQRYLRSIFAVVLESSPELRATANADAEELAWTTTEQCFEVHLGIFFYCFLS